MRSGTGTTREAERAFLQHRLRVFAIFAATGFGFFLLYRVVVFGRMFHEPADPSLLWHLAATLSFVAVGIACSFGPLTAPMLRTVEVVGTFLATDFMIRMGFAVPALYQPDVVVAFALQFVLVARSIFIPSSTRRTLVLTSLVALSLVISTYYRYLGVAPSSYVTQAHPGYGMTATAAAALHASGVAAWSGLMVFLSTAASAVIYGLRRQVEDARQLGQYRLEEKLGEGGMGLVYRASHAMLRRRTAVKLLSPTQTGEEALQRFEQEVQRTAELRHPNVVRIYDYGRTPDGVFYYAMELIDGATLREIVEVTGALPIGRVVHVLEHIAAALVEAHGIGLIHRDLKPANVMLHLPHHFGGVVEMARVLDFGLVKQVGALGDDQLSVTGNITGTPQYMSPESIRSPATVDARSDLYALGAIGYYLVTGRPVFDGGTAMEVCGKHLHVPPEPPSVHRPMVGAEDLERLLLRCLEKQPESRPASALELQELLSDMRATHPWTPLDAQEWWDEYGAAIQRGRSEKSSPAVLTIDIDRLRRRATSTEPPPRPTADSV